MTAELLKLLICVLPFVLICLLAIKANLPKSIRYVQFPLPILALVYGIIVMYELDRIGNLLLDFIYYLIKHVSFLAFLDKVNWAYGVMYVINIVMVLGFMAIKAVVMPLLLTLRSNQTLVKYTAGWFYEYDEQEKCWHLKTSMTHARTLLNWMYVGGLIISSLLFVITYYFTSVKVLSSAFYPAFGILILGEFFFFLNGKPKEEKGEDQAVVETGDEEEEVEYDSLKEVFEKTFPDRLSDSCEMPMADRKQLVAAKQLLKYREEYEQTFSQEARLMFHYYSNRLLAGKEIDDSMLHFTKSILEGKSVLFLNQFYEDTTEYVFLPVVRHLMRNKKILIIVGRSGAETNIGEWFRRGMTSVNNFDNIWKINLLSECDSDTSIAILPLKDIYNQKILHAKAEFLEETSMVFVMDPTRLLSTMQIGLSCVVSFLKKGQKPQYIAYDRNCDGLVDSLSHVLGTSIEQVGATAVSSSESGVILWDADGEMLHHRIGLDVARYLGVGTELAVVALRGGVSQVKWLAYQKFPVTDMRWIIGQYYVPICKIIETDISQTVLEARFGVQSDMWSLPKTDNAYLVVEDEYNNQFETARQFSTRGTKQSFLHVISQNFWLRDYMADNADIFRDDPKSIPNVAPDYQRSVNNTVYKIIMRLISGEVSEEDIRDMLDVINADTQNIFKTLCDLIQTYFAPEATTTAIETALSIDTKTLIDRETFRAQKQRCYSIKDAAFIDAFLSQLKVSYYLAEDESDKGLYLGSILYGHVYQKYLPGMFTTLEGKYYEIVTITQNNGVVVRRAADHISTRRYYRHLRRYSVSDFKLCDGVAANSYGKIRFERGEAKIAVDTIGYIEMQDFGDMCHAKRIEVNNVDRRIYAHKNLLRIDLGQDCPESVRITIANLLNELFVTIFPDSHEYITATTYCSEPSRYEGYIQALELDQTDTDLYIIEDSLIDLGLLINVDRYFKRLLEIICDVLSWHNEKLEEEEAEAGVGEGHGAGDGPEEGEGEDGADEDGENGKKKSWLKRLIEKIKAFFAKLFRKKKKDAGEDDAPQSDEEEGNDGIADDPDGGEPIESPEPVEEGTEEPVPAEAEAEPIGANEPLSLRSVSPMILKQKGAVEGDDGEDIEGEDSDSVTVKEHDFGVINKERAPYSKRCFLRYGYEAIPDFIDVEGTLTYLVDAGFANNYLEQARGGKKDEKLKWYNYRFEPGVHYCDFCGAMLQDQFDILDDGRERCSECSATAITKLRDFKKLYRSSKKRMESVFGIKIKSKLKIRMVSATSLAESMGEKLVLSPGYDCRVLGYAYNTTGKRELWIENGAPAIETEKTLIHELTHIWQYENMPTVFEKKDYKIPVEGMAVWAEVQYLTCIGEKEKAEAYTQARLHFKDEYGLGLEKYLQKFPIVKKEHAHKRTPFCYRSDPLE